MKTFLIAALFATSAISPALAGPAAVEEIMHGSVNDVAENGGDGQRHGGNRGGGGGGWRGQSGGGEARPAPQPQGDSNPGWGGGGRRERPTYDPSTSTPVARSDGGFGSGWRGQRGGSDVTPQVQPQPQTLPDRRVQADPGRSPWGNQGDGRQGDTGRGGWRGNRGDTSSPQPERRGGGIGGGSGRDWRGNRGDVSVPTPPQWGGQADRRQDSGRQWGGDLNRDRNQDRGRDWNRDRNGGREFGHGWDRNDNGRFDRDRRGRSYGWNDRWRNDDRYDWRSHRNDNRQLYRSQSYYNPYGRDYGYRRFSIGIYLDQLFFGSRYWINDPWDYRLPQAYGSYRWVRYYDDVLLIDLRSGRVVDAIYGFFW
jgi:Nickel/cobalt transporter regulator